MSPDRRDHTAAVYSTFASYGTFLLFIPFNVLYVFDLYIVVRSVVTEQEVFSELRKQEKFQGRLK